MDKLYYKALEAFQNTYSPYSHFGVGAALLMKDGTIINGANIENASFGLSCCAERTALFTAYTQGYKKDDIVKMLVLASTPKPVSPCGACRQVISELLNPNTTIVLTNLHRQEKIVTPVDLLPFAFGDQDLI